MFIRLATGLVVIGGDSCSKGREFKSQNCILDGHVFEKTKMNEKEAGVCPFKKPFLSRSPPPTYNVHLFYFN